MHEGWDRSQYEVPEKDGFLRFHDLEIPDRVLHAVADLGFQYCTPIQAEILPHVLKGTDASGRAQTGTGKTAAFLTGIFTHLLNNPAPEKRRAGSPRVLILGPTRELVLQIADEARDIGKYCPFNVTAIIGGMEFQEQKDKLTRPMDIVVATPGRLLDFKRRRALHLGQVEILVIDEADRMLDMGFIPDVRQIVRSTPPREHRQTLLFSATLTPEVMRLAQSWTRDPVTVEIDPGQVAVDSVEQVIYITTAQEKFALLYNLLTRAKEQVLVFGNRRDVTQGLTDLLRRCGIDCRLLSGSIPQERRLKTIDAFREGRIRVLVATDVAGRGLHVEGIGFVINYNLPDDPEDYVHRIGRTGRAGATGTAISFACEEESFSIPAIEKFIGYNLPCTHPEPELLAAPPVAHQPAPPRRRPDPRGGRGFRPRGRSPRGRR